jgi:hypothetical protein
MKEMLFMLLVLTLVTAGAARAKDEFFISHWCGPTELTQERFAEVAGANFTVAMLDEGSAEANVKALDLCKTNGIKGLVIDSRTQPKSTRDKDFAENFDAVIKDYAGHPALWGYCVIDEPSAGSFNRIGGVNRYLLEHDPKHIPYVNLQPTYATKEQLGNWTYEQHVDEFCKVVKPKMLSYDHYALMADGTVRGDYFLNLEIIRRQSIKHSVPFNYILLSLPHLRYKDPTEADIRWQAFTALAYGARGLMYFTYMTPGGGHNAIIDENGKPTAKYAFAKKINGEIRKLGPTLLRLNTVAIYHTGTLPVGCKPLPQGDLIASVKGGEFVIGQFNSDDGFRYAMLVNRSLTAPAKAVISFAQDVALSQVSPASGKEIPVAVSSANGTCAWNASFAPGEGKLVRIEAANGFPSGKWEDNIKFRPRIMLNPSNQFANQIFGDKKDELYNEGMNMFMIAEKVQKILQMDGRVDAFISRNTQTQVTTLGQETRLTRALGCDMLFAMHSDATGTSDPGGGTWTFYNGEDGKRFADLVQNELITAMKGSFYPDVKNMGTRLHWYRLWVLYEGGCQGALTEFLFHTNPKEREMLKDPKDQEIMAQAVAKGILKYFFGS